MKVLALDVGGTAIKSAYFMDSSMLSSSEIPSEGELGAEALLKNIFATIESYSDYDVIGISTTGQVNNITGKIIYASKNIPDYTGTELMQIVAKRYNKRVVVENDVNAAAIGEGAFGSAIGTKDYICITYGTGIGGAIVMDGKLYTGANGIAGEVGHLITHPNGRDCNCGGKGCYERYASVAALVRDAMEVNPEWSDGRKIFASLSCGDKQAKMVVDNWIDEVIFGLVGLVHTFDPSTIILGGGIMREKYIVDKINSIIKSMLMPSYGKIKILSANLANNAGIYGMLARALNIDM
ncbi:MAG: ROK family protein [Oscillospiraceae bacterium]